MSQREGGRVLLVGAGPGDADLLTVRALRAIESAEAVLYDALVGEEIIALAPQRCVKINVGKRGGRPSMAQEAIIRLMLRLARRGLRVVRLKGGDPSIFARVDEERRALAAAGVPFETIPGVTAACAAAAAFEFPLTLRGNARSVLFVTARSESGGLAALPAGAADPTTTLAVYMGGACAGDLARALAAVGRAPQTPAALIERAGSPQARASSCTIATLEQSVQAFAADGPMLIVIGAAAAHVGAAQAAGGAAKAV